MSKELEALNYLYNDLRLMKCLDIVEEAMIKSAYECLQQALQRLEAIDNSNPSEALKCLHKLAKQIELDEDTDYWEIRNAHKTVEQALLKAQEPKQYLKWEDLEFKEEVQKQIIKVKKNDNLYILKYYISVFDEELIEILANDWTFITGLSNRKYDKQFFNDLHLERVEE